MTHRISVAGRRACELSSMSFCGGALAAAAVTILPHIAYAQDAGAESAPMIAEVVVTSRRIEENLQATPVAVTALSGAELEARGINSLAQIESVTPNLNFDSSANISGSNSAASVFIRG